MRITTACAMLSMLLSARVFAADPSLNPGKWQATITTEMPLITQPARQDVTQCIAAGNTGPVDRMVKDGNCTITKREVSGNSLRWEMQCKSRSGPPAIGTGVFSSDGDSGTARMEMTSTFQGKPLKTTTTWTGKRIGPCD